MSEYAVHTTTWGVSRGTGLTLGDLRELMNRCDCNDLPPDFRVTVPGGAPIRGLQIETRVETGSEPVE